jgi:hypothetical protein
VDQLEAEMPGGEPISEAEKIRILLAEHGTLRAEIIARMGHMYQMIGYGVAAIILLVGLAPAGFFFGECWHSSLLFSHLSCGFLGDIHGFVPSVFVR